MFLGNADHQPEVCFTQVPAGLFTLFMHAQQVSFQHRDERLHGCDKFWPGQLVGQIGQLGVDLEHIDHVGRQQPGDDRKFHNQPVCLVLVNAEGVRKIVDQLVFPLAIDKCTHFGVGENRLECYRRFKPEVLCNRRCGVADRPKLRKDVGDDRERVGRSNFDIALDFLFDCFEALCEFNRTCENDFICRGQQRDTADLAQIHPDRVFSEFGFLHFLCKGVRDTGR